jgi:uncharacterized RDD family membrane protein YckC
MKCPKCGYLGFETTDRCRHCGYDFSFTVPADPVSELPLRPADEVESTLADFDLDRVIGEPDTDREPVSRTMFTPPPVDRTLAPRNDPPAGLPLFPREQVGADDGPLVPPPPPARPPLAVRRATPEVARRRTPRSIRRDSVPELHLEPLSTPRPPSADPLHSEQLPAFESGAVAAPKARRIAAALIDLGLLAGITTAVLYLTLAIVGLSMADVFTLPVVPMGAFLLLLNGGYLVAFTAANGQTVGKMLFSVRVIGEDNGRVDIPGSLLRAAGVLLGVVTFGIAYLPALLSRDGRALHDRLAKTRVIKHA